MPRLPIDYSNTIIYKLCCTDPTITDIYVGHTTNWTNRKKSHKSLCNNETSKKYNLYVYKFIREHGGWNNWSMIELEKLCCIDTHDALKNERKYIELLGATLNSQQISNTTINSIDNLPRDEYVKQHYMEYKEHFTEYKHDWYETNKERILEKQKEQYDTNKAQILEKQKERYEKNKESINEKRRLKYKEKKNAINHLDS